MNQFLKLFTIFVNRNLRKGIIRVSILLVPYKQDICQQWFKINRKNRIWDMKWSIRYLLKLLRTYTIKYFEIKIKKLKTRWTWDNSHKNMKTPLLQPEFPIPTQLTEIHSEKETILDSKYFSYLTIYFTNTFSIYL